MPHRRPPGGIASQHGAASCFDRFTVHAFAFTVTVTAGVLLGYGPGAALHHIADVLADPPASLLPDETVWSGQTMF